MCIKNQWGFHVSGAFMSFQTVRKLVRMSSTRCAVCWPTSPPRLRIRRYWSTLASPTLTRAVRMANTQGGTIVLGVAEKSTGLHAYHT